MSYQIDWDTKTITLPGFVDAHLHYPQTAMIGSWGADLLDWLERYTFPEESKFTQPDYAQRIAKLFVDQLVKHGVTTAAVFSTVHPQAFAALLEAAQGRLHLVSGLTAMDRHAPDALHISTAEWERENQIAYDALRAHRRMTYAVTPRFAITSTPEQLAACGAFHQNHPDTLMQTHINENLREIEFVSELFPRSESYLQVYADHGLLTDRSLFGHAIYGSDEEVSQLVAAGASVVHCPTSNTFLGSGLFPHQRYQDLGGNIALGSDVGGGTSFSPWATMAEAYKLARLRGYSLTATQLVDWHTMGGAKALHLDDKIGSLEPGKYQDYNVFHLEPRDALVAERLSRVESADDALFALMFMMCECPDQVHVERHFDTSSDLG